ASAACRRSNKVDPNSSGVSSSRTVFSVNATQKATLNKDAAGSEEVGDRLSKLPNDILLNILERVDTLDAIRTCILSKRMMKLCTELSQFFLSCSSIPGHNVRTNSEYVRTNSAVAHVTDNILSTKSPEITISKLKIRFILMQPDCYTIGKSVARTMATQKVGAAEFEIITEKIHKKCSPADLLDHAKQFNDFFSACLDAFAGLKRLWLRNMRFGESDIPNILSTCKLLESLHLTNCDSGMNSVVQLEHAKLTELEVKYGKFEIVELTCLPKLQRVSYKGWFNSHKGPLYFGFVPQLSKLRLTKIGTRPTRTLELSQLLDNVPHIGNLHLDFQSEKIWVLPESPKLLRPVLSQLQQVNLDNLSEGCDLAWTMFILEAAPS
uniref:F-box domain-containing protein n=1 Tax=Aegilops tauschii subsp. strangulata TaxID=200361 RepID=A0A453C4L6_AEGTS